jgi:spectinomycin phosphotransferase
VLENPNLPDTKIIRALQTDYGVVVTKLDFLPIGNDSSAWVYRVGTADGQTYFLKVKRGAVYAPSVIIPRYLREQGMSQVVAPLPTQTQAMWASVDGFALLLYPFVAGDNGMAIGLSDQQWIAYGAVLRQLHTTSLSPELLAQLSEETFVPDPKWSDIVKALLAAPPTHNYKAALEKELAEFWCTKQGEISKIVARTEALGRLLQQQRMPVVLCHADIHTANLLLDPAGQLFVVDWDQPILAPKERDLMFVVGASLGGFVVDGNAERLFFQGYGQTEINWLAIAYYRYAWVVQDLGDYAERVFLMENTGEETKRAAVQGLMAMFAPGDVVDVAYQSEAKLILYSL